MGTNKRKKELLGMPHGTAANRLRKMILFHILKRHNENTCFRCGKTIDDIGELSIEHKASWQLGGGHLFWDMENIAFSHLKCNRPSINLPGTGSSRRKIGPHGTAWCNHCKVFLSTYKFYKNRSNWNGYANQCIDCMKRLVSSSK
jgi:hypothetical protein